MSEEGGGGGGGGLVGTAEEEVEEDMELRLSELIDQLADKK